LEYDYYKLLGLPAGSDAATVRKAYLALVRQHHPDLNPGNTESENFIKILNQGWEILSNPGKKEMYDALLYNHYNRASRKEQSASARSNNQGETRAQRASHIRAERNERYVADFGRKQAFFRFQILVSILLAIGAPFYAFNNWFVDFDSYDHMRLLLAAIFFGAAIFRLIILAFRYYNVYNILHPENPKNDAVIYGSLLLSLFVIPMLLFQAGEWRKQYHLSHYATETAARITYRNGLFVIYDFEAGGATITKNVTLTDQFYSMDSLVQAAGKLRIRYSERDPRITEEITWILNPHMP
jgi:hypothetical protein